MFPGPQRCAPFVLLLNGLGPNLKGCRYRSLGFESDTPGWNPLFWHRRPARTIRAHFLSSNRTEYRVYDTNRRYPLRAPRSGCQTKAHVAIDPLRKAHPFRFRFYFRSLYQFLISGFSFRELSYHHQVQVAGFRFLGSCFMVHSSWFVFYGSWF